MFVKICGITTEEDALLAVAMGADAIGFNFVATSPRQVAVNKVADIIRRLPSETLTIGIFRDALPERVIEVVEQTGLRGAQLHGAETLAECAEVAAKVPFVIKALPAYPALLADAGSFAAHAILIDSPLPGSGEVFDWRVAETVPGVRRLILAGGLTVQNVGEAIRRVGPWGVDVATGVEASPGHKDPSKVRAFIKAARDAAPNAYESDADAPYDWQEELG